MKGEIVIQGKDALETWMRSWVDNLRNYSVLAVRGDLGVGKTTLCQALMDALGYKGEVTSPTFTLHHTYEGGARRVDHFDLYRIEPDDFSFWRFFDEMLAEADLALVEWPERHPRGMPKGKTVEMRIAFYGQARSYAWETI